MNLRILVAATMLAIATPSQAFFGDLGKQLKDLEQGLTGALAGAGASKRQPQPQNVPPGRGAAQGEKRDMFAIAAEVDRETRRGPVGRLQLGFSQFANTFGAYPKRLSPKDPRSVYVGQIVRTLAAATRMPYQYQGWAPIVVQGNGDACAASGGLILVETNLFNLVETEDELAAVLAHEIAHVEIDHSGYDFKAKISAQGFDEMMNDPNKKGGAAISQAQLIYSIENMRGYSVQAESEADARAIHILRDAGYNPWALLRVIERITGEPAGKVEGIRYVFIENLKYAGASSSGGGNKYPKGRATLLKDELERANMPDTGDAEPRTARFMRIARR